MEFPAAHARYVSPASGRLRGTGGPRGAPRSLGPSLAPSKNDSEDNELTLRATAGQVLDMINIREVCPACPPFTSPSSSARDTS